MGELVLGSSQGLRAKINTENAQLFSLALGGEEHMHPGGKPGATEEDRRGWANSEIVMFPIVGPAQEYTFAFEREYRLSQHGTARNLPFRLMRHDAKSATFLQQHDGEEPIPNPKWDPQKQGPLTEPQTLLWPFKYGLEKHYEVLDDRLRVQFRIRNVSEQPMPYAFGWHPAFKFDGGVIFVDNDAFTLNDLRKEPGWVRKYRSGSAGFNGGAHGITVTADTGCMMLWSPQGSQLLCIEPITRRPGTPDLIEYLEPHMERQYIVEILVK